MLQYQYSSFFFFNDTATTEIYTLSLHDALPIWARGPCPRNSSPQRPPAAVPAIASHWRRRDKAVRSGSPARANLRDRKSTRLNSSHANISYAVFCLKKKKKKIHTLRHQYTRT